MSSKHLLVFAVRFWACPVSHWWWIKADGMWSCWRRGEGLISWSQIWFWCFLVHLNLFRLVNKSNYNESCPAAVSLDLTKVCPKCRKQPFALFLPHLLPSPALSLWCDLTWPAQSMSTQLETQAPVFWTPNPPPYSSSCHYTHYYLTTSTVSMQRYGMHYHNIEYHSSKLKGAAVRIHQSITTFMLRHWWPKELILHLAIMSRN